MHSKEEQFWQHVLLVANCYYNNLCKMIVSEMLLGKKKSLQAALNVEAQACEKPMLHFTCPRWVLERNI